MLKVPSRASLGNKVYASTPSTNPYYAQQPKSDKVCPRCQAGPNEPCIWVGDNPRYFKDLHIERVRDDIEVKPEPVKKVVVAEKPKVIPLQDDLNYPDGWGDGPHTNSGHGQLWSRPDGRKLYCGGAMWCDECHAIMKFAKKHKIKLY